MFTHHQPLRFSDTDAMGHVNNARFLSYLEDARVAFFREIAQGDEGMLERGLILARVEIDYRRPIELSSEPVTCELWVTRLGTSSFEMAYHLRHGPDLCAEATTVVVCYDYAAGSSRPLSEGERESLARHLDRRRPDVTG